MGRPRKSAVTQTKDTPKSKAKEPEEESENLSLTLTRSRRTPKPNPKYSNDVIVPFSSSRVVTGDSSRSTTPAKSETSEELVPLSEEDEEETPKMGTRKRGRPKKPAVQTPEPTKRSTPQSKPQEKKETPQRRLPERATKQQTPDSAGPPKRKREEEPEHPVVTKVDNFAKKRIKALVEKLNIPTTPAKPQQPIRSAEKRPAAATKAVTSAKAEIVDVAGTRENVKIVDVSEILNKKHDVVLDEPKRVRKCPPEMPKGARPLYSSKILSQPAKVAPKLSPVGSKVAPKVSPINRQLNNNGKINSVPRFPEAKKMPPLASRCPVIDLTRQLEADKPKRALKDALMASSPARKPPVRPAGLVPLRPLPGVQRPALAGGAKTQMLLKGIPKPPLKPVAMPGMRQKREITCFETWHVVQLPAEQPPDVAAKVSLGITLKELAEQVEDIRLPSETWSHSVTTQKGSETPTSIAFQRRSTAEAAKRDRSVNFKATELIIEIEGNEVTLVGAPESLTTAADIQTLLQIVDDVSLKNSCVEQVTVVL
ncbi:mediator of DNA damage checkpoint protein 1-like [Phlebotomus argentipes]|uniref:mediator of DNA damage checkpoint protein 1-like n=1 Tax=Phlebotomus argentipes TaxID=94469 RepID=UPI002892E607|nr:mediator of DNA damage checkpoint protein 1-like [Phlebotomus argentipes]